MGRRRTNLSDVTPADLAELFVTFKARAFRLEAQGAYLVPEEEQRLAAYRAGWGVAPRSEDDTWLSLVFRAREAGRHITRVRVVDRPLNDYTRFQLAVYPENIDAGEDVSLVLRSRLPGRGADERWHQDFWFFDFSTVVVLRHDEDGRLVGLEERADHRPFMDIWKVLMLRSVEYHQFLREHSFTF